MTREQINDFVEAAGFESTLVAEGLDDAFIGITDDGVAVYSKNRCVRSIMEADGISEEEAIEYLEFNTYSCYVGEMTPLFITTVD